MMAREIANLDKLAEATGSRQRDSRGGSRMLYDTDTAAWAEQQADALRRHASNEIDWDNVAEEIEFLARSDRREIRNRLAVICTHLFKWVHSPGTVSSSWRGSIREARHQILDLISESPSLHDYPVTVLAKAYARGLENARDEAKLTDLPAECPWTIVQILDTDFLPDGAIRESVRHE